MGIAPVHDTDLVIPVGAVFISKDDCAMIVVVETAPNDKVIFFRYLMSHSQRLVGLVDWAFMNALIKDDSIWERIA